MSVDRVKLQGYTNSDLARNIVDKKSTSGCCFNLESAMISWLSKSNTQWHLAQ